MKAEFQIVILEAVAYHDIPLVSWPKRTAHLQNHPCQQPEKASNTVLPLVIGRNANVNITHGGISIAECDGWNIPKSSFLNWLQAH